MEAGIIIIVSLSVAFLIIIISGWRKFMHFKKIADHAENKTENDPMVISTTQSEAPEPAVQKLLKDLEDENARRLELEKQLRIKEARFELALEGNNDGLWDWNIATNEVYLSPRWISTLGFKNGEIEQNDCLLQNLLHPDDWEQAVKKLEVLLSGQNPDYENIIRIRAKSGDWLWIYDRGKVVEWDESGKPLRIMGTYTNLTEKKRQELIQQIQQRIGIILGSTGDFVQALSGLLGEVLKIGGINFGGVYIINHLSHAIELICHQGFSPELEAPIHHFSSDSPLAKLIFNGNAVFESRRQLTDLWQLLSRDTGLKALAILPVRFENEVVAALILGSYHANSFSPADQVLLEAIAAQTGGVIARVRAEKSLKESQANFQRLFDTSRDFLFIFDVNGRILRFNAAVTSRLGFSAAELTAMKMGDLFVPSNTDEFGFLIQEIVKNDRFEFSLPIRTRVGSLFPTETSVTRSLWDEQVVFFGISRDISERQKAEIALIKRDRILAAVSRAAFLFLKIRKIDLAVDEVLKTLGENIKSSRILIFQNSVDLAASVLRYEWYADEKFKKDVSMTPQIAYVDAGLSRWAAILSKGESIVGLSDEFAPAESRWLCSQQIKTVSVIPIFDGDHWWGFIRFDECENQVQFSSAELDALRSAAGLLGSAIERRKIEDELHKYRGHLEELVQMRTTELSEVIAELKAFAYSVSHDLRAPLRAMYGFSQVLIEDYGALLDERGQDYAKRIESAAKRMENLIQDLLNYSTLSRTEIYFHSIDMNSLFENILLQMKEEIQQSHANIHIIKPLPAVIGHQLILEQIFSNLLSNAIKFVPPDRIPQIKIRAEEDLKMAVFWIMDNGIGIDSEYHDRIFQVFERLYPAETYPGTGIGLAIVRRGVDRLGGSVGLESTPGSGTKFWIRLRRAIQ